MIQEQQQEEYVEDEELYDEGEEEIVYRYGQPVIKNKEEQNDK